MRTTRATTAKLRDSTRSFDGPLPAPFDSGRLANHSLNPETVKYILVAGRQTGEAALANLVEPLGDLVKSAAWVALVARRDAGYHCLRSQRIEGGVPSINPWATDQAAGTLTLSVSTFSDYVPPVLEDVVAETHAGYEALSSAMLDVHDRPPEALRDAGVPIWRTP